MAQDTKIGITYEALYEILLREKQREELQQLDPQFWPQVLAYLREKQGFLDESRNKVDLFSAAEREKTTTTIRNVKRIIREMYDRREKKIIDIAMNKSRTGSKIIDTSNLLETERQFFEAVVNEMNFFRQGLLNNILDNRDPSMWLDREHPEEPEEVDHGPTLMPGMTRVTTTQHIPQFIGKELEVYGPFPAGETIILPQ